MFLFLHTSIPLHFGGKCGTFLLNTYSITLVTRYFSDYVASEPNECNANDFF